MYKVAIVGATGTVGAEILNILQERNFPLDEIYAISSEKSQGKQLNFGENKTLIVHKLEGFDFSKIDIVLSTAGADISASFVEKAVAQGAIVIDNTSHFRTDPLIPLIIPEVNAHRIINYKNKGIIANPNCTTIQMLMGVAPLHKKYGIKRIVASTYQSVSGAGNEALEELFNQTKSIYSQESILKHKNVFTKQIAFNVIPHIDVFLEDGSTKEEWKLFFETQKILESEVKVTATCVRVPVFISHSIALNMEFEDYITEEDIRETLQNARGVSLIDYRQDEGYVTPLEVAGEDNVFISRIRKDITQENTFNMWVVGDNLRKGAALNAVQIAEELIKL